MTKMNSKDIDINKAPLNELRVWYMFSIDQSMLGAALRVMGMKLKGYITPKMNIMMTNKSDFQIKDGDSGLPLMESRN